MMKLKSSTLTIIFFGFAHLLFGQSETTPAKSIQIATTTLESFKTAQTNQSFNVALPNEKAVINHFNFQEIDNGLPPNLKAKYPEIKLYRGISTSNPTITSLVTVVGNRFFGDLIQGTSVQSFTNRNNAPDNELFFGDAAANPALGCGDCNPSLVTRCNMGAEHSFLHQTHQATAAPNGNNAPEGVLATTYSRGTTYKIFKFAMVMSYWQFVEQGYTTLAEGLAFVNSKVAVFNDVFGKEVAVSFQLVPNNDLLIHTDASDIYPEQYLDDNAHILFGSIKIDVDNLIGNANYDWAFLLHPSGTGWAGGNFCGSGKHAGVARATQSGLILHEMGHMFGCPHAYHLDKSADIPNITTSIVGSNGGRWFHSVNFEKAATLIDNTACGVTGATGNTVPTVSVTTPNGIYIPASTPFVLRGSATDPDATASLTHAWQHCGFLESEATDPLKKLLWAHKNPSATGNVRYIPDLANQIANTTDIYSQLPTVSRQIVTRYIVRDNQVPYGSTIYQEVSFNVDGTAGPFLLRYPNTALSFTGGQNINVTWDVANTNNALVNVQNVNILLSTDQATTWTTLASNVANNGSYSVALPNTPSTQCRIKIEAVGNIFYDMSNVNFTIVSSSTNDFTFTALDNHNAQYNETSSTFSFNFTKVGVFTNNVNVTYSGIPSGASIPTPTQLTASGDFNVVLQNTNAVAAGKYPITITLTEVGGTAITKSLVFTFVKKINGDGLVGNALRIVQEDRAMIATVKDITSNTFTMSAWIKPTQTGRDWYRSGLLFFGDHTGIFINPAGKLGYLHNDFYSVSDLTSVTFNQWQHIALVVEPNQATLYLNGVKIGGKVGSHIPISLGTTLKVGKREWYATVFGDYDEVKIFDKSLTLTELREEMHRNINYQSPNLIHYYQFNEASGNPISPVSFDAVVLESSVTRTASSMPSGDAVVQSLPQSTALTNFTGTNVSLKFATTTSEYATVHKINVSPNALTGIPLTQTNTHTGSYWEINTYPTTGNTIVDAVFTVNYDIQPTENANTFVLYKRGQTANDAWVVSSVGYSIDAAANTILFKNIPNNGQYVIYKSTDPAIDLAEIDATATCFLTTNNNKVFQYLIQGGNLTNPVNLSFDNSNVLVSTNPTSGFAASIQISPVNGSVQQTIYAKYVGSTTGNLSITLTATSIGTTTQTSVLSFTFKKDAYNRGNAMVFDGTEDRVQLTGLTWQPTVFSAEFWYKPNNDFRYWNHKIGRDGQFFFHSDANKIVKIGTANTAAGSFSTPSNTLEAGKWIHIAYTYNNGAATLYLNGKLTETKTGVPVPDAWSDWAIGVSGTSTLNGMLDEFRIWSTARTQQQIQENMHLINDLSAACTEGLKAYYQFENNTGGIVEDMAGNYNGTILDNPTIAASTAPLGFGKSQTNTVATGGVYSFSNVNISLEFPSTGLVPNGNLVVTELTTSPDQSPSGSPLSKYWIIDNYGSNSTFAPLKNARLGNLGAYSSGTASNYKLYLRSAIADGATWSKPIDAASSILATNNNTLVFNQTNTCTAITSFGQLSITNDALATLSSCIPLPNPTKAANFAGISSSNITSVNNAPDFGTAQNFTISFWFKSASTSTDAAILTDKDWDAGANKGWVFALQTGKIKFNIGDGSNRIDLSSQTGLNNNAWHHVAATVTRTGTAILYIDGVNKASMSATALGNIYPGNKLFMGTDIETDYAYAGLVDEIRIWNTALTQDKIRENMNLVSADGEANLINYYQFNEVGTTEYDFGSIKNNLTINNTSQHQTSSAPVGGGTSFRLNVNATGVKDFTGTNCQIEFTGTLPNNEIVVTKITNAPNILPSGDPLSTQYWVINNFGVNTGLTAHITFTPPVGFITNTIAANYQYHKRVSNGDGVWQTPVTANTATSSTLTFNGATSFSQFLLERTNAVLPLELLYFTGNKVGKQVNLTWQTANERDLSHFEVQRSADAKTFDILGTVKTNLTMSYFTTDFEPRQGINYYRLKMVDIDGSEAFSKILSVSNQGKSKVKIYPTITEGQLIVEGAASFDIVNTVGQVVVSSKYDYSNNVSNLLNLTHLTSGIYFIRGVDTEGGVFVEKIVKK
jgi:hypothetical protein